MTRKHGEKEIGKRLENDGLEYKANNPELSLAERHHWTQVHTYTAQVLNTILRDLQLKDWEKRLKEIEQPGLIYKTLPTR